MSKPKAKRSPLHSPVVTVGPAFLAALAAVGLTTPARAQTATVTHIQPCIVAGDPNGAPPDSPSNPYDPATMSGRLDANTPASPFAGVVSIAGGGSGVLLDSTHVLTAAHVIEDSGNNGLTVFVNYAGDKTFTIGSQSSAVDGQFQGVTGSDAGDIGIITLSQPVPSYVPTYRLYTQALTAGTTLTFVGYGASGSGVTGYNAPYGSDTVKRVGENNADMAAVDAPGGFDYAPLGAGSHTFLYDFDGPDSSTNIFGDPSDPKNLTLDNDKETTIGNGDSGSPAFLYDAATGHYLIAGINDFDFDLNTATDHTHPSIGFFGSGGGGAIVSAYTDFIYRVDPAAAPEPHPMFAFGIGSLLLLGGAWRARRRV